MSCLHVGVRSFAGRSCVTLENEGHLDQYRAYVFPGVWAVSLQGSTLVIAGQDMEPSSWSFVHHVTRGPLKGVPPASQSGPLSLCLTCDLCASLQLEALASIALWPRGLHLEPNTRPR